MASTSAAPVFLAHASSDPRQVARRARINGADPVPWLYLGRDYTAMLRFERSLGGGFRREAYSRRLNALAMEWRRPYLEWIAAMAREHDNLVWWSSRIAERNTLLDSLFHKVCYLGVGLAVCRDASGPVLVVAESRAVLWSLETTDALRDRVRWAGPRGVGVALLSWVARFVAVWGLYFLDAMSAQLDAWLTRRGPVAPPRRAAKPLVLIHSCMDESSFTEGEQTRDRYFTVLPDELRRAGYAVVTVPWLYTIRRSRREAFRFFRERPNEYLVPEDYYRLVDYAWAAWIVWLQGKIPAGPREFEGMNVTLLVREARRRQCAQSAAARFVRHVRLVKRASALGLCADVFIDTFENMLTEKPLVMALRQYLPATMKVGFQHWFAPPPLRLDSFSPAAEAQIAPHPDVIVCNSGFMAELLEREGIPREKLRVGPSLRYLYMQEMREGAQPAERESGSVLVVASLEPGATAELLHRIDEALGNTAGLRVWLKPHPMMTDAEWARLTAGRAALPMETVVEGPMGPWLARASAAIVSSSTAALEIALAGVPVISVARETDFDMDPRVWFPELLGPVYTSEELRARVREALQLSDSERGALAAWAADARKRLFSPLTPETVAAFTAPI